MEPDDATSHGVDSDRSDLPDVTRLLSLSDGVVAIALTLLVLNLRVPTVPTTKQNSAHALAVALGTHGDQIVSYLISFYVIAQFWLAHHRVFRHMAGHEEGLAWWNFAFLLTITLMPFTSNLLSDFPGNALAVDIFAVNLLLASLSTQAVAVYGKQKHLLVPGTPDSAIYAGRARALAVAVAVGLSIGIAWVNTSVAKYCWLLMALAPWVASHWIRRRRPTEAASSG